VWAEEWHASLKRYGALELNERYRRAYNEPMSAAAWAGWFAVKCAAEAAFRASPERIAESLRSVRMDGHKGVALRFLSDGTLEQPLYLVGRSGPGAKIELLDEGDGA
jgi:ABC-type branched-subunit amino acid transport system substrate-binding protein